MAKYKQKGIPCLSGKKPLPHYGGEAGIGFAQASLAFGFRKVLALESRSAKILCPNHEKKV
jgi:hypothetical protein